MRNVKMGSQDNTSTKVWRCHLNWCVYVLCSLIYCTVLILYKQNQDSGGGGGESSQKEGLSKASRNTHRGVVGIRRHIEKGVTPCSACACSAWACSACACSACSGPVLERRPPSADRTDAPWTPATGSAGATWTLHAHYMEHITHYRLHITRNTLHITLHGHYTAHITHTSDPFKNSTLYNTHALHTLHLLPTSHPEHHNSGAKP
jgi:hypothetical protein